jgi:cytochrome c oxidase cbb3-type subunit 3
MGAPSRSITVVVLASAWIAGVLAVQGSAGGQDPVATPASQEQTPAGARGGGGGGRQGGGRRGGFTQFTRPQAMADVIVRGRGLYETNCASCHAVDLRGTADGKNPNLLRSGIALRDQKGELIAASVGRHEPSITLIEPDIVAVAEYIHSVHASMGGQGSPPGRNPTNVTLNVLVGNPARGEEMFLTRCASCHGGQTDVKTFAAQFSEPRDLQNAWVSGGGGGGGGGGRGGAANVPATVTLANGSTLDGTLVRQDDFLVILLLPDGTRRSFARIDGIPKVEIKDPRAGHVDAIVKMAHDDADNSIMHDITAYLWALKGASNP